jgi:hypothetical protein
VVGRPADDRGVLTPADDLVWLFREWGPVEFHTSPLYAALSPHVADDPHLLDLVARRRPGVHPTVLFFGAVHHVVLGHPDEDLAAWFPSIVGTDARPPAEATAAFQAFCGAHDDELGELIRTRMVQTNVVRRAVALRYGLSRVPLGGEVHLIEVGTSAGILLRHDRFRLRLADQVTGPADATVDVASEWRGTEPAPDLTDGPALASVLGVDLNPLDPTSEADRRWLRALVWPENLERAAQMEAALAVVAADPPQVVKGDIRDLAEQLDAELPHGEPRVVFHAATRGHVPREEQQAFDDAIAVLDTEAPLTVLAMESPHPDDPQSASTDPHFLLTMTHWDDPPEPLAHVEGHGAWIEPVRLGS